MIAGSPDFTWCEHLQFSHMEPFASYFDDLKSGYRHLALQVLLVFEISQEKVRDSLLCFCSRCVTLFPINDVLLIDIYFYFDK